MTNQRRSEAVDIQLEPAGVARWERWIGHIGYVAEAVVYLLIGGFAFVAAIEPHEHPNGSKGALAKLGAGAFGKVLLGLLAAGLGAFVLWQLILAIRDPEHRQDRTSLRRRLIRLGHLLNGVLHSALVGEAVWLLFGVVATQAGKHSQVRWTARAMALPLGRYAVGGLGVGIALFGLYQFYRAATRSKSKRVDLRRTRLRIAILALGVYGLIARGVLFALIGVYLFGAAWEHEPRYSRGIGGALNTLKQQPYGPWLLGTVGAGLISYGLFQIAKERYRRFRDS
ncbi:MAG TPA: DUF1206 domain-containing protein [Steroidobacteraceae bacterium]